MHKTVHGVLSLMCTIFLVLFILSFSIGLPIYIRPFYYAHIEALDLSEDSGYTAAQIRAAYDEVLNYLTLPGQTFSTGDMPYSQDGAAHFSDCKTLFTIDASVLLISLGALLVLFILQRVGKRPPYSIGGRSSAYWAGLSVLLIVLVVGVLVMIDFDGAFTLFHKVLFPGKSNWKFDPNTDPIILVLPEAFFLNCAILIGAGIITWSVLLLLREWWRKRRAIKA